MTRLPSPPALRCSALAAIACALSACTTTPPPASETAGQQATFEGTVVSVDTSPWAYDGNAVVVVARPGMEPVQVHLPARWNLCKAEPVDDVQTLKPDDPVHVAGTLTERGVVVVCEQPEHHLRRQ